MNKERQDILKDISHKSGSEYAKNFTKIPGNAMIQKLPFTFQRLIKSFTRMRYTYPLSPSYTTVCFKATRIIRSDKKSPREYSAIYAYVYYDQNTPKYASYGSTYESQDGEFRSIFLRYEDVISFKNEKIKEIAESYVVSELNSKNLTFDVDILYSDDHADKKSLEVEIDNSRIALILFMNAWIMDYIRIKHNIIEDHVHPGYFHVINDGSGEDAYKKIMSNIKSERGIKVHNFDTANIIGTEGVHRINIGQKLFTMPLESIPDESAIEHPVWREIEFACDCMDLIVNAIAPGFPFINNSFYIENSHAGIFDNPPAHDKFEDSKIARKIAKKLHKADKNAYKNVAGNEYPRNEKFHELSRRINSSIKYSEDKIQLSSACLVLCEEYAGFTLGESVKHASLGYNVSIAAMYKDMELFTRSAFEFVYNLYCMNSKLALMHSDLHINNATFHTAMILYTATGEQTDRYGKLPYHTLYGLDEYRAGKKISYLFKTNGVNSTIIDMSRGILADRARFAPDVTRIRADQIIRRQTKQIISIIREYFPDFVREHNEILPRRIEDNFFTYFKVFSALDTLMLVKNWKVVLSETRMIKISPAMIKLLEKIEASAEKHVLEGLTTLINENISDPGRVKFVNKTILMEVFSEFEWGELPAGGFGYLTPRKDAVENPTINDAFDAENEIEESLSDYDKLPFYLTAEHRIQLVKKLGDPIHEDLIGWKKSDEYTDRIADVEKILQDDVDKLLAREFDEYIC